MKIGMRVWAQKTFTIERHQLENQSYMRMINIRVGYMFPFISVLLCIYTIVRCCLFIAQNHNTLDILLYHSSTVSNNKHNSHPLEEDDEKGDVQECV